jgi:CubicO group peptidase (beta-lactamase class C family)
MRIDELTGELGAETRHCMELDGVPGVALGVRLQGEERTVGCGITNRQHPLDVTADTIFQVGSISKIFTATAILRFVERAELDLDAPVRSRVPKLELADPDAASAVTLRHLLTHTAGFDGDFAADTGRGDDALGGLIEQCLPRAPQWTPLGRDIHYSNLGFALAGHVLECAAGVPFERVVGDEVIKPLGLPRSSYFPERVIFERVAGGHTTTADGPVVSAYARPRCRGPNGGVLSSVHDLLAFARFHLGDGRLADGARWLTPQSLASMQEAHFEPGPGAERMGLGWMLDDWAGHRVVSHGGATLGFQSYLVLVPEADAALVFLSNSDRGTRNFSRIWQRFLEGVLDVELPPVRDCGLAPDERAARAGRYFNPHMGLARITFDPAEEELRLALWRGAFDDPVRSELLLTEPDRFEAIEPPLEGRGGHWLRDSEGAIRWLRLGGRLFRPCSDDEELPGLTELLGGDPERDPSR